MACCAHIDEDCLSASGPGTGFRLARCVPRAAVVSRAVSMLVSAGSVSDLEIEKWGDGKEATVGPGCVGL